jgi:hypothetical protein
MNITAHEPNIRQIKQSDPKFMLKDKFVTAPRAGFEIDSNCPSNVKQYIVMAIENGWLRPVAHVYGKELTMDSLR